MGTLKKVFRFIQPFRNRILLALVITVVMTILGMVPPIVTRYIINDVVEAGKWNMAPAILMVMLVINFLSAGLNLWSNLVVYYVSQLFVFNVRDELYRHLQKLSLGFYEKMGTGRLMNRIMGDVSNIQSMVTWQTLSVVNDIISFCVGLAMTFYLSWQLALITLAILPFYFLNYYFFVKRIRRKNISVWQKMDRVANSVQERIRGTRMVRAFVSEDRESTAFAEGTREVQAEALEGSQLSAAFSGTSQLINGLGYTVIYCLGCYMVIVGKMSYGDVAAFGAYVFRILQPALRFTEISNMLQQTAVSVGRVFEVLDTQPEVQEAPDAYELPPIQGRVEFRDVWFEYVPGEPILKGINLIVEPGQTVALVGHTGCGKTTMTSLLMRFYDIKSGQILIDGHDISKVTLKSLRRQVGVVLQESILFNATVRQNLRYGKKDTEDSEVINCAKIAEIHDFVVGKPDAYDTIIGDGGIKLSVGEKQRMSIARAVLTNPGILVLDEATSSLDSKSESLIQKALQNVMKNRTSFVIAHRLSTIVNANMIVVMEKGQVLEKGNHWELLDRPEGAYRQLYEEQFAKGRHEAAA
ncbi:MAG: ABC transporter ATP-binding protein [Candidatus Latescibacteria bacterium]|nr:ABC transporter ATP-binding protein [Candidatus Latescibacterota bacterium]